MCADANHSADAESPVGNGWWRPHDGLKHYQGDVQAITDFGFDGVNIDACGIFRNMTLWAELLNATKRQVMIEDCHFGRDGPGDWGDGGALNQGPNKVPADRWCPFNFFRISADIRNSWARVFGNVQPVTRYQPWPLPNQTMQEVDVWTGPGCFAYPDQMEIGNLGNFVEERSHFGLCVPRLHSPLFPCEHLFAAC